MIWLRRFWGVDSNGRDLLLSAAEAAAAEEAELADGGGWDRFWWE